MQDAISKTVAIQLKQARADKGWSLDKASQQCQVSKAMLGQIERQESSPTIKRLWNIATGFALPLSYFFSESQARIENEQGINIETLFAFDKQTQLEVFSLTLQSQHEQLSDAHNKGIIEHVIVISGEMECLIEGSWVALTAGQSIKFDANQAHGYRNQSAQPCTFHNIISYPQ